MKNDNLINAWGKLDPSEASKTRILDKVSEKIQNRYQPKRTALRYIAMIASITVVISVVIFGAVYIASQGGFVTHSGTHAPQANGDAPVYSQGNPGISSFSPTEQAEASKLPVQESGNAFTLLAFSFELQADGSVMLSELNILDRDLTGPDYPFAMDKYDPENDVYYSGVGLICKGSNLDHVHFSVDEGFFGMLVRSDLTKWYYSDFASSRVNVMEIFPGDVSITGWHFNDFIILGKTVSISMLDPDFDCILMWGITGIFEANNCSREIAINAEATFNDGTTAGQVMTIDYMPELIIEREEGYRLARIKFMERLEYYRSIPLEQCELIPGSVQKVTHVYRYDTGPLIDDPGSQYPGVCVISEYGFASGRDGYEFDDDGVMVICGGDTLGDGDVRGYILVIKLEDDGSTTGMLYRTPLDK